MLTLTNIKINVTDETVVLRQESMNLATKYRPMAPFTTKIAHQTASHMVATDT